jgi:hypothetical protein
MRRYQECQRLGLVLLFRAVMETVLTSARQFISVQELCVAHKVGQVAEHVELGSTKGFLELVLASVESVSMLPSLFCVRVTPAPVCGPVDVFFGAT